MMKHFPWKVGLRALLNSKCQSPTIRKVLLLIRRMLLEDYLVMPQGKVELLILSISSSCCILSMSRYIKGLKLTRTMLCVMSSYFWNIITKVMILFLQVWRSNLLWFLSKFSLESVVTSVDDSNCYICKSLKSWITFNSLLLV